LIRRSTVIIFLVILLFLGMVYAPRKIVSTPVLQGTLHPGNTDKYGTSQLADYLRGLGYQVVIGGPGDIDNETILYIVLGPDVDYTTDEMWMILEYVRGGGSLLYANEFAKGLVIRGIYLEVPPIDTSFYSLSKSLFNVDFREAYCNICGGPIPLDVSSNIELVIPLDRVVRTHGITDPPEVVLMEDGYTIIGSIGIELKIDSYYSPDLPPLPRSTELVINVTVRSGV